jgi:hypothetical protein
MKLNEAKEGKQLKRKQNKTKNEKYTVSSGPLFFCFLIKECQQRQEPLTAEMSTTTGPINSRNTNRLNDKNSQDTSQSRDPNQQHKC